MAAPIVNFRVWNNARFTRQIRINDGDTPRDLTGLGVWMQVRRSHRSDWIVEDFNTDNGLITIDDATGGLIGLDWPTEILADIPVGLYHQDCIFFTDTYREALWAGSFTVDGRVTRDPRDDA